MDVTYGITGCLEKYMAGMRECWPRRSLHLTAARNEHVNAQLVLATPARALVVLSCEPHLDWTAAAPRIRVAATPLAPATASGSGPDLTPTLRFQHLVPDDYGRLTADALPLDETRLLESGRGAVCALWLSLFVPADARPGTYKGTIGFYVQQRFEDEKKCGEIRLNLTVARTCLPDPKEYRFHLDLWQHPASIARCHNVPLWSDAHFRLIKAYLAPLAALGQKMITIIASDVPWAGQGGQDEVDYRSSVYEHSMIRARKTAAGRLRCDFTVLDRYVDAALECGVGPELEVIGLLGVWGDEFGRPIRDHSDNIRIRYLDEASGTYRYATEPADLKLYVRQLAAHLEARKLLAQTYICSDEPADVERFGRNLAFLREVEPRLQYRVCANHAEFMDAFIDSVSDWVPYAEGATSPDTEELRIRERVRVQGGRFFWYVCCGPEYPNTFIRSPLLEARLTPWITRYLDCDGFLRWAYCCFPSDPWKRPQWRWNAGDMAFVYPGRHGGPVLTTRYEALRAGIQDYELLALAERNGRMDAVRKAMRKVIKARSAQLFRPGLATPREQLYTLRDADVSAARRLLLDVQPE